MKRFIGVMLAVAAVVAGVLPAAAGAAPRSTVTLPSFVKLGVHPHAAQQPTADGRRLVDLTVHGGKVFAGYGDYNANTGPIVMGGIDATGGFAAEHTADTEAIYNQRVINGRLFAPATDPRVAGDYSVSGPWADQTTIETTHVYDMATLNGSDLWMVGSRGDDAVAWRSLDGGATWSDSLVIRPRATDGSDWARFYFAGVLKGKLYVQAVDANSGAHRQSMAFDGSAWTAGPAIVTGFQFGWKPQVLGEKLLLHSVGHGWRGEVISFDGRRASSVALGYGMAVAGGKAYVLDGDGVRSSTDLRKWAMVAAAPGYGRSLAVEGGTAYVGTANAEIWSVKLAG